MATLASARTYISPRSNTPLFEALVCEAQHASALTAIVASCINGAQLGCHQLDRAVVDQFLPIEPAVLLSLTRRSLLEIEPMSETRHVIDSLFGSLRALRLNLNAFFSDGLEIGAQGSQMIHIRRLQIAARACCHEALRTVRALELEIPGRLPDLYNDHSAALSVLLMAAERGGTPCLDRFGEPFMPALPQRRRSTRRSVGQNGRLLFGKAVVTVFIKDVSEGGMGLLRVPFLKTDDPVTIELASGRQFKGRCVWARGEEAGVRFNEPLSGSDPLLAI